MMRKVRNQALKDYVLFPALTGPLFPLTLAGNATANLVRNIWAFNIIFCGHFPAGVATFTEEEMRGRVARPLVLPPAARLGEHHRRQAVPRDDRQPVATRSSTTCSRTCRPAATRRSPPRCARSASATACPTTPVRCAGSSAAWPRKICRLALPPKRGTSTEPDVELSAAA